MVILDWDSFKAISNDFENTFEELSNYIFCEKYEAFDQIQGRKNHAGIEREPIIDQDGELVAYQAKFLEISLSQGSSEFIKSIKTARKYYNDNPNELNIEKIILFTNKDRGNPEIGKKLHKYEENILNAAGDIEIEWYYKSSIESFLQKAENYNLILSYFGSVDDFGFIYQQRNEEFEILINSDKFIKFNLNHKNGEIEISDIKDLKQTVLIKGSPGSGKSLLMYHIFHINAHLGIENINLIKRNITKTGLLPLRIQLNLIPNNDLLAYISLQKKNFDIPNRSNFKFLYLLDGLDELKEIDLIPMLSQLNKLKSDKRTQQIIVSSRSASSNLFYFDREVKEYDVCEIPIISKNQIVSYFEMRNKGAKKSKFANFTKSNNKIVPEITDILSLEIFWETIEKLDKNSSILDLFPMQIERLFLNHSDRIADLNILKPKKFKLEKLVERIAFDVNRTNNQVITLSKIQEIVISDLILSPQEIKYDAITINKIIDFLLDLFFVNSKITQMGKSYIFRHRRYNEYFLAKKVIKDFDNNIQALRSTDNLLSKEYYNSIFYNYAKSHFSRYNLIKLEKIIVLNLIKFYLEEVDYLDGSKTIYHLVSNIDDSIFQILIEDKRLLAELKIHGWSNELQSKLDNIGVDYMNTYHQLDDYYKLNIQQSLEIYPLFFERSEKKIFGSVADKIGSDIDTSVNFMLDIQDRDESIHPYYPLFYPNYSYYPNITKLVLFLYFYKNFSFKEILTRHVHHNKPQEYDYTGENNEFESYVKLLESYFDGFFDCLDIIDNLNSDINEEQVKELLIDLDVLELSQVLFCLSKPKNLLRIHKINSFIGIETKIVDIEQISPYFYAIYFFKQYYELEIQESLQSYIHNEIIKIQKIRPLDWKLQILYHKFSLLMFANNTKTKYFKRLNKSYSIYNEVILYSYIFYETLNIINNPDILTNIANSIAKIVNNFNPEDEVYGDGFLYQEISELFSTIFYLIDKLGKYDHLYKVKIIFKNVNIDYLQDKFYFRIRELNFHLLSKLVDYNDISSLEARLSEMDTFYDYSENCFALSSYYYSIDDHSKFFKFLFNGINDVKVRYGPHKDTIASIDLLDSLELIQSKNWLPLESLEDIYFEIFKITLALLKITDGDGTRWAIIELFRITSQYQPKIASNMLEDLLMKQKVTVWIINSCLKEYLIPLIEKGEDLIVIEEYLDKFRYDRYSSPLLDKFVLFLHIADNNIYTSGERRSYFEKAWNILEFNFVERNSDFSDMKKNKILRERYSKLAKFFEMENTYPEENENNNHQIENYQSKYKTVQSFELEEISKGEELENLFNLLSDYDSKIAVDDISEWIDLYDKCYELLENFDPIINLMKNKSFPQSDIYLDSMKYCAVAGLDHPSARQSIINYFFKSLQYQGFKVMIFVYELKNNRSEALKLFLELLAFCKFLVFKRN